MPADMSPPLDDDRSILAITGADRIDFLQNLVTNSVTGAPGLIYAALLSPQGKYLSDFFLKVDADRVLLDAPAAAAPDLLRRLTLYKLRADVQIAEAGLHLHRGLATAPEDTPADTPEDALPDPRDPGMGWRAYRPTAQTGDGTDWDALRVRHAIPAHGVELRPDDSFILEMGFERLGGVDFRKGCYVGQEVTARMKHKTELRKGLARVTLDGPARPGDEILTAGDGPARSVGYLGTVAGGQALAYLRFDRAQGPMVAGEAQVTLESPQGG